MYQVQFKCFSLCCIDMPCHSINKMSIFHLFKLYDSRFINFWLTEKSRNNFPFLCFYRMHTRTLSHSAFYLPTQLRTPRKKICFLKSKFFTKSIPLIWQYVKWFTQQCIKCLYFLQHRNLRSVLHIRICNIMRRDQFQILFF